MIVLSGPHSERPVPLLLRSYIISPTSTLSSTSRESLSSLHILLCRVTVLTPVIHTAPTLCQYIQFHVSWWTELLFGVTFQIATTCMAGHLTAQLDILQWSVYLCHFLKVGATTTDMKHCSRETPYWFIDDINILFFRVTEKWPYTVLPPSAYSSVPHSSFPLSTPPVHNF